MVLIGALKKAHDWVDNEIHEIEKTVAISRATDIHDSSKEILQQLDPFTSVAGLHVPQLLIEVNKTAPTHETLDTENFDLSSKKKTGDEFDDWEKDAAKVTTHAISNELIVKMLRDDELFGNAGPVFDFATKFVRKSCLFPLDDKVVFFKSEKDAIACTEDLNLAPGMACPETYNHWGDMSSDESFTRFFFNGMGAVGLAAQKETPKSGLGPFEVDMPIQNFEVRPGFRPYGARVYFGADQKPTGIFDYANEKLVKPGDEGWESAKWLAKSTAFTLYTCREHLMWGHLIISNKATMACTTNLPPSHPIRRLLTIFTFRTNTINDQAFAALVPEVSTLHRATAFTYPALVKVFEEAYKTSDVFEPFCDKKITPELQALCDQGKFPYYSEGNAFFEIVRTFVKGWLAKSGPASSDDATKAFYAELRTLNKGQAYELPDFSEEALVNAISQTIFYVTAMHEIIGTIIDYARIPNGAGTRVVEGAVEADAQAFLDNLLIVSVTGLKMPKLMKSFDLFFGEGGAPAWEKETWKKFVQDLEVQSRAVQEANAKRVEFKFFDPALFECSISV